MIEPCPSLLTLTLTLALITSQWDTKYHFGLKGNLKNTTLYSATSTMHDIDVEIAAGRVRPYTAPYDGEPMTYVKMCARWMLLNTIKSVRKAQRNKSSEFKLVSDFSGYYPSEWPMEWTVTDEWLRLFKNDTYKAGIRRSDYLSEVSSHPPSHLQLLILFNLVLFSLPEASTGPG